MPTRKLIAISVVIAVAVIGFAIKTMTNSDTLLIQGEVEATRIDLTPRVSGRVSEVLVDFGDKVEKGQPLANVFCGSKSTNYAMELVGAAVGISEAAQTEPKLIVESH